jgi:multifunctional 2-oxoglutarate metabolism enzyme
MERAESAGPGKRNEVTQTVPVTLPAMGESVTEGTIVEWRRRPGEEVAEGEVLADVTTDKVDVEVPAPVSGVLASILIEAGSTVAVGAVIGEIAAGAVAERPGDGGPAGVDAGAPATSTGRAAAREAAVSGAADRRRREVDASTAPASGPPDGDDAGPAVPGANGAVAGRGAAAAPGRSGRAEAREAQLGETAQPASAEPSASAESVEVTLPAMGESVTEGTVSRWLKSVGEAVTRDEPILEVTTDKVDVEVPAPVTGRLVEIRVEAGATVQVGGVLGVVAAGEAAAPAQDAAASPQAPAIEPQASPPRQGAEPPSPEAGQRPEAARPGRADAATDRPASPETPSDAATTAAAPDDAAEAPPSPASVEAEEAEVDAAEGRRPAPIPSPHRPDLRSSPLARRAAAVRGVDLASVRGTGPAGMVRSADVTAGGGGAPNGHPAGAAPSTDAGRAPAPPAAAAAPERPPAGATPLHGPAASLAAVMEQSREIPTATSFRTVTVDVLAARRSELQAALRAADRPEKVSFTHLVGHAIVRAATDVPAMTTHFERTRDGAAWRVQPGVHLGIAVDTRRRDGTRFLLVPVVRDAARLGFAAFRDEYERLIARARSGSLGVDELRGASIVLTNPGGLGTAASVPRLMPGQGTIVATGAIGFPVEVRGIDPVRLRDFGIARVMTLTSTYDHRVIQGAESGEFLGRIEALLAGEDGFYEAVFDSLGLAAPSGRPATAPLDAATPARAAAPAAGTAARAATAPSTAVPPLELLSAVAAGMSVVKAHRTHGHLAANLDPLGREHPSDPAMDPHTVGLTPALMAAVPASVLRVYVPGDSLAEVLPRLRETYTGTIAYEIEHISSHEQRIWLREHIESGAHRRPLSPERKLQLLARLTKVEAMERYFRRAFIGQKTFSIEGLDAMVPMLEELLTMVAADGIGSVVMGTAHRGRLAIIAHVVNRPYDSILVAFERGEQKRQLGEEPDDPTGDVKYHLGATGTYLTDSGKAITVRLLSNPSHLEAVDPVVEGWTRAEQTRRSAAAIYVDPKAALPLLIHGDAAFPAQGVVSEVLNLQSLAGYSTGGTVHIIANNQVGFTTDPQESRSTRYASDLAKGYDIPIVHVNADDVEACIHAMRLAYDYRRTYHRDVVVDLVGYRRFGHNEVDEPSYTQPTMYRRIKAHPTAREIYAQRLIDEGLITREEADEQDQQAYERVARAHQKVKGTLATGPTEEPWEDIHPVLDRDTERRTGVSARTLEGLHEQLLTLPDRFTVNPKLVKQMERRRASLAEGEIDWAMAESLALGSLLLQGRPIRLTGQDTERGTFSQRHLAFHDAVTGARWTPMEHLTGATATFELHNSPLSEAGCLGFEYGYSIATPDTMVVWEAQFGDFVNNAQVMVDQFVVSGEAKWEQRSRLVLLLPHGYEGQGPEHSSARLERFLQLASLGNIRVANCSTAAQYFHLLRQQALMQRPRPLVIFTPKSLLRARTAFATLEELAKGRFQRVIDDPEMSRRREQVRTLLLCTGKMYHDLITSPLRTRAQKTAIARIELLDPLPLHEIRQLIESYPNLEQLFWVQEEPMNMGAWNHLARPIGRHRPYEIRWEYIGRPRRASPSEGFAGAHQVEQERIVEEALSVEAVTTEQARDFARSGSRS